MPNYEKALKLYGTSIIGTLGIVYGLLSAMGKVPYPSVGTVTLGALIVGLTFQRASEFKYGFDLDSMNYVYSPAYGIAVAVLAISMYYSSVIGGVFAAVLTSVITWLKYS